MNSQKRTTKAFYEALENLPERGEGLHCALLGVCNIGVWSGLSEDELFDAISDLDRDFKPHEVEDAIQKAIEDAEDWQTGESYRRGTKRNTMRARKHKTEATVAGQILTKDPDRAAKIRENLIQSVGGVLDPFGPVVRAASNLPSSITAHKEGMAGVAGLESLILFLKAAYRPDDRLFIGSKYLGHDEQPDYIKTVEEWCSDFSEVLVRIKNAPSNEKRNLLLASFWYRYPAFCINPLTGEADEEGSFRSMACVKEFRYTLFEADNMNLEQQIPLILALELPVVSLIFSGHKSIHALTRVNLLPGVGPIRDLSEWESKIPVVFSQLAPLGFDPATKDSNRLTRVPGIWRPDTKQYQQLLFLNTNGGFYV